MKLHSDPELFSETIQAASQFFSIKQEFIEKDYWITLILHRLAKSKYLPFTVFKGGTSLSKGYRIIDRFSEDIDLAIVTTKNKSGNEIKNLLRSVEKEITKELKEIVIEEITSKGSKFRRSVFEFISPDQLNSNNHVIVETNAFTGSVNFYKLPVQSLVRDFFEKSENQIYAVDYELFPATLNILSCESTMLEKVVSLIRFSYDKKYIEALSAKIRHFYDIHFLLKNKACKEYISSELFLNDLKKMLEHDRSIFDDPVGWSAKPLPDSPLLNNFNNIWQKLKNRYQSELTGLAYRPVPHEDEIAGSFNRILSKIL